MHPGRAARAVLVALAACGDAAEDGVELPWEERAFPAVEAPADNPTTPEKVELGRLLFYDPVLSRDGEVACASCHSEEWGLGDGLPLSVGVDGTGPTGPGRHGPNKTTRNALTLWNVVFRPELFWDGRTRTLEEQALLPIRAELELDRDPDEVATELAGIDGYQALFAAAFPGEPIGATNLARALAAFERTMITELAPYDRYALGDRGALKEAAVQGMFLFAEVGCAGCHTPPLFESPGFAARGIGDGSDVGRFEQTGVEADRGAFRVPTLRNLRETGPYFHDGSVETLEEAVLHELERDGRPLEHAAAIATFLRKGLMDRSRQPHRPETVPSGLEVPKDGFRIPR
jgi:cytochrome c peroxidase